MFFPINFSPVKIPYSTVFSYYNSYALYLILYELEWIIEIIINSIFFIGMAKNLALSQQSFSFLYLLSICTAQEVWTMFRGIKQVLYKNLINCSLIRGSVELCPVIAVKIHLLIYIFLVTNGKHFVKKQIFRKLQYLNLKILRLRRIHQFITWFMI